MSDVERDVPPPAPADPPAPAPAAAAAAVPAKQPIEYRSFPRPGGAAIDIDPDGSKVYIRIPFHYDRPWPLVIGFGLFAALATAKVLYDALAAGRIGLASDGAMIVAAVLFALLALAASMRGGTPPLQIMANPRDLRVHGGFLDETLGWRRDHVLDITAEQIEQPPLAGDPRLVVVIEARDDEYLVFPVATREEQAAVVQALRGALGL